MNRFFTRLRASNPCRVPGKKAALIRGGRAFRPIYRGKTGVMQTPQLAKAVSSGLVFTHRNAESGPRQPPLRPAFSSFNASLREKHRVLLLLCNRCAQARTCGATLRPSNTLSRFADLAIAGGCRSPTRPTTGGARHFFLDLFCRAPGKRKRLRRFYLVLIRPGVRFTLF